MTFFMLIIIILLILILVKVSSYFKLLSHKIELLEEKLTTTSIEKTSQPPNKDIAPLEKTYTKNNEKKKSQKSSKFVKKSSKAFAKIYNWLVVGEEFRPTSIAMEYSVITVWLTRIAIIILLFGISFFIKYSHDNNLISPTIRIAIVIIIGGTLIGCGSYFINKKYHIISLATIGLGLGALYFAGFSGTSLYKICSEELGFGFLILVTALAIFLAIRFNALSLALISLVGGYIAPFLVSNALGNLEVLTSYLLILTIAELIISRYKNWPIVSILAFVFNVLMSICIFIIFSLFVNFITIFVFCSISFLLFSASFIVYNIRKSTKISALEVIMSFLNFIIYSAGSTILFSKTFASLNYLGYVAVGLTLFYGALIFVFWRIKHKDQILYSMINILAVIALCAIWPLLLNRREVVTLVFSLQGLGLIYLAAKSRSNILNILGVILFTFTAYIIMFMLNSQIGFAGRFMSLGIFSLALIGSFFVQKHFKVSLSDENKLSSIFRYAGLICIVIYILKEASHLPFNVEWNSGLKLIIYILTLISACCFLAWRSSVNRENISFQNLNIITQFLVLLLLLEKIISYFLHIGYYNIEIQAIMFLGVLLMLISLIFISIRLVNIKTYGIGFILFFVYTTLEIYKFAYHIIDPKVSSLAISLLWAIYAVLLLYFGLKLRCKILRIIGFILFIITSFKIIFIDTSGFGLYRIGAFLIIGILMMAGAMFYIKNSKQFLNHD